MDELERCYEGQSNIKTQYFQALNNLELRYCNYIESILIQKESIKKKLKDKYSRWTYIPTAAPLF